ncbi:MAG: hypothetical protein HYS15_01545 [Candidatus Spechtbacteria bacterium]|nr:hypothetical protein [Candidatus Spechtbacteria bacterium]
MNEEDSDKIDKQLATPPPSEPPPANGRRRSLKGVYEYYMGKREGLDVWIVNGSFIRRKILSEFLFGGNDHVYNFIPEGEIWLDSAINAVELEYTVQHELTERNLIAKKGLSYDEAHKIASVEEQQSREKNHALIEEKEKETPRVPFSLTESRRLSSGNPWE